MKLPAGHKAIIDPRKLTGYALSRDHEDGKHKALVFERVLGVRADHAPALLDALREAAIGGEAVAGKRDQYGQRYEIDFSFAGPAGTAVIRSAWILRTGEDAPRFVTCYIL
jgi:hypothetical protein